MGIDNAASLAVCADRKAICRNSKKNSAGQTGRGRSLLFIENMRDWDLIGSVDARVRSAPHELGHQCGRWGDAVGSRLMGYRTTS